MYDELLGCEVEILDLVCLDDEFCKKYFTLEI